MAGNKTIRLSQAARRLNVSSNSIREVLERKGHKIDSNPNAKLSPDQYEILEKEFKTSMAMKQEADGITIGGTRDNVVIKTGNQTHIEDEDDIDLPITPSPFAKKTTSEEEQPAKSGIEDKAKEQKKDEPEFASTSRLTGPKVVGKIDLDNLGKPKKKQVAPEPEQPPQEQPKQESPAEPTPAAPEQEAAAPPDDKKPEPQPEQPKAEEPKQPEAAQPEPEVPASETEEATEEVAEAPPEAVGEDTAPAKEEETAAETPKETTPTAEKAEEQAAPAAEKPEAEEQPPAKTPAAEAKPEAATAEETTEAGPTAEGEEQPESFIEARAEKLQGLKVVGKIDLPSSTPKKKDKKAGAEDDKSKDKKKRKRKRIQPEERAANRGRQRIAEEGNESKRKTKDKKGRKGRKEEVSEKDVESEYKKTLAKLSDTGSSKATKRSRKEEKRQAAAAREARSMEQEEAGVIKITEFISTNELATIMEVNVNDIIAKCLEAGMFVSINQRLEAETIEFIADEFGYKAQFTSAEEESEVDLEEEDKEEDLQERAPIVTIMGHVDHGKTSLLDFIRKSKVADAEAGGITQHIGAYSVKTASDRDIVFLDTPGHEAFTAMRARGAKVTDVVIIVIAADDSVMPQTVEAINHAQVAGVPIVIAINKVDKPGANPHKIKEELANMNLLVEEWGGKIQCQEISAKQGSGIEDLLEMVVLEADILELKANPNKKAVGTVIEASLDKGRGYVTTVLVQTGTLKIGDIMLAGQHHGRVRAMSDSRGTRIEQAPPSTPVQLLGLNGAPQAGDKLNVLESERQAREIAGKRQQIMREQQIRATKRTTLSDIGKRIAMGNYQQLNVVLKGDVDGSVEALTDSLQKLSTDEVEVIIIHKAVGPISENDVLLASASEAVVIGFQVRPTPSARKLAEREDVEIRLYSVIYHAIDEVKQAMEGLLSPDIEETIVGTVEIREVFKISKVGTVAGCYVTDGYIKRNSKIRLIRDGIVTYGGESGGEIDALKRYKDDVSEVKQGFECGLSIKNYNDIKVGDVVEVFEEKEVKRKLEA